MTIKLQMAINDALAADNFPEYVANEMGITQKLNLAALYYFINNQADTPAAGEVRNALWALHNEGTIPVTEPEHWGDNHITYWNGEFHVYDETGAPLESPRAPLTTLAQARRELEIYGEILEGRAAQ